MPGIEITQVDHWTELLDQDEIWQDRHGVQHRLDDMDPAYCARIAAFILRDPDAVVDYLTRELQAYGEPDGYQAGIDYERGLAQFFHETSDAAAWLRQQPLVEALLARATGQPTRASAPQRPKEQEDEDPFGPWEYVEPDDRCRGHGDGCEWGRCTGRESTCHCMCPVCLGETAQDYGFDGDY